MNATVDAPPASAVAARRGLLGLIVVALVVTILAHGCHGDDVDHEPGVTQPLQKKSE